MDMDENLNMYGNDNEDIVARALMAAMYDREPDIHPDDAYSIALKLINNDNDVIELMKRFDAGNNRTYKIISRDPKNGRQFKKRVYSSLDDYLLYGDELTERYSRYYDVEHSELIDNKWIIIKKVKRNEKY